MKEDSSISSFISREDRPFVIYYVALSVLTVLLTRPNSVIGELYRIIYSAAIFIPPLLKNKWLPFSLNVFVCVSMCSFSPLLPSKTFIIVIVAVFVSIFQQSLTAKGVRPIIWLFLFFMLIIDLFYGDIQIQVWYSILIVLICFGCINNEDDIKLFALSFVFVSVILSSLFLLNFEAFLEQYAKAADDVSRSGWINPNVFGGHLSLGAVTAYWLLRSQINNRFWLLSLLISMGVVLVVLFLNASRGALIATVLPIVISILFSKMRTGYKIVSLIIGITFVVYSFNSGYFELLIFRFSDDTIRTGGSRFSIWAQKLNAFTQEGFLPTLFGVGQTNCESLGNFGRTHNDFVTALLSYGLAGLLFFVIFLFTPLFRTARHHLANIDLLAFYTVLLVECCVLEPFFRGYLVYYMFFLFIHKFNKVYILR